MASISISNLAGQNEAALMAMVATLIGCIATESKEPFTPYLADGGVWHLDRDGDWMGFIESGRLKVQALDGIYWLDERVVIAIVWLKLWLGLWKMPQQPINESSEEGDGR